MGSKARFVHLDLRDRAATLALMRDVQPGRIFHLAALHFIPTCIAEPSRTLAINVMGTQHLLDGCGELATPPTLVFASTADVYAPQPEPHHEFSAVAPDNVYGLSKYVGEQLLAQSAGKGHCLPIVARLFNLYGPGETNPHVMPEIISQLRSGNVLRLGNTSPRRDYVYVADAAAALIALSHTAPTGTTWNVGTGKSYSVQEVIDTISTLLARVLTIEMDPARYRASDRMNLQSDPTAIRSLDPTLLRTELAQGLRSLLEDEGFLPTYA
jgi:UDP-glucose 4-epimerase